MAVDVQSARGVLAKPLKLPREERARRRREMLLKALREALASPRGESSVEDEELRERVKVVKYGDGALDVRYFTCGRKRGGVYIDEFNSTSVVLRRAPDGRYYVVRVEALLDPRLTRWSEWGRYSVEELGLVAARAAEAFNDLMAALGAPLRVSGPERSGDILHAVLETPLGRYRGSSFTADMVSGVPRVGYYPVVRVGERLARRLRFLMRYAELAEQEGDRWREELAQRLSAALDKEVQCPLVNLAEDYRRLTEGRLAWLEVRGVRCEHGDREVGTFHIPVVQLADMDLNPRDGVAAVDRYLIETEDDLVRVLEEESRRVVEVLVRAVALMRRHPDPIQREHAHFLWALIEKAYYDTTGESLISQQP
jgi:hypothetical protein